MSWLFSRVLVEEFLGDTSLDGEQFVQSSGNPIQLAYCAPDKMMGFSRLSRFGMMFKPLTEDLGEELLMLFRADFHAQTFQLQEKELELMEKPLECGAKWRGWLAKYDQSTSSWKTPQCSLLGEELESLETLPKWGMTVNGLLWELQTLEPITKETECGLSENWPTPRSCSAMAATITPESAWNEKRNPNLETIVGQRLWPTPTAHMAKETNAPSEHKRNTPTLTAQVNWPTPRTKGMCGGSGAWDLLNKNTTIEEARQMGAGNGGKLNPTWVEWLMGWPLGWTDLKPLEMGKFQEWQQQHSIF